MTQGKSAGIKPLGSVADCNYRVTVLTGFTGRAVLNLACDFIGVDWQHPKDARCEAQFPAAKPCVEGGKQHQLGSTLDPGNKQSWGLIRSNSLNWDCRAGPAGACRGSFPLLCTLYHLGTCVVYAYYKAHRKRGYFWKIPITINFNLNS